MPSSVEWAFQRKPWRWLLGSSGEKPWLFFFFHLSHVLLDSETRHPTLNFWNLCARLPGFKPLSFPLCQSFLICKMRTITVTALWSYEDLLLWGLWGYYELLWGFNLLIYVFSIVSGTQEGLNEYWLLVLLSLFIKAEERYIIYTKS